jgi:hypothetical protein
MNFSDALYLVLRKAEKCALRDDDIKSLDACHIIKRFVNYLPNSLENQMIGKYTDFCDNEEKMKDFNELSKDEFLESYSYIIEEEYNLTRNKEIYKRDHPNERDQHISY